MAGKTTKVKRKVKDPASDNGVAKKATSKKGATVDKVSNPRTGAMERLRKDVHKIAKDLQGGTKMKDVRAEYGFGSGGAIRAELAKNGYDSKGGTITLPTLPTGAKSLAKALVREREAGVPWYTLEIASGKTEAELREIVEEQGGPTGRVYRQNGATESERRPAIGKDGKGEKEPAKKGGVKRGRG